MTKSVTEEQQRSRRKPGLPRRGWPILPWLVAYPRLRTIQVRRAAVRLEPSQNRLSQIASVIYCQALRTVFRKYPIYNVYLFGSQALGNTTESSDYDFGVQVKDGLQSDDIFQLKIKLSADLLRVFKRHVDIVIMNAPRIPTLLNFNIIKNGKIIYSRSKWQRIKLEVSIMREWRDWQYYENIWSSIYIRRTAQS